MSFRGVFVATVTPFSKSGELLPDGYRSHLSRLLQHPIQGFVPGATTGESSSLSTAEWETVVRLSVEASTPKKLTVIAGCGSNDTETALKKLKKAAELGCAAGLVVTPYYNKPTPRGVLAHFEYLADHSPIPIILYNNPGRTGIAMDLETVLTLFKHTNIVGIKEASNQHAYWVSLAAALRGTSKAFLAGDDDALATTCALGGHGIISASANIIPQAFCKIWQAVQDENWTQAFDTQKRLAPLIRAFFSETSPAPIKKALAMHQDFPESVRLPLVPVLPTTEKLLSQVMQELKSAI